MAYRLFIRILFQKGCDLCLHVCLNYMKMLRDITICPSPFWLNNVLGNVQGPGDLFPMNRSIKDEKLLF